MVWKTVVQQSVIRQGLSHLWRKGRGSNIHIIDTHIKRLKRFSKQYNQE